MPYTSKKSITELIKKICRKYNKGCPHWPNDGILKVLLDHDMQEGTCFAHEYLQSRHQPDIIFHPMTGEAEIRCSAISRDAGYNFKPCDFCDNEIGKIVMKELIEDGSYLKAYKGDVKKVESQKVWEPIPLPKEERWDIRKDIECNTKEKDETTLRFRDSITKVITRFAC